MTYYSPLKLLNLESLEVRKRMSDLTFAYKILFGVINSNSLFMLRNQPHLRGHKCTLTKPRCIGQDRRGFFQYKSCQYLEQFTC